MAKQAGGPNKKTGGNEHRVRKDSRTSSGSAISQSPSSGKSASKVIRQERQRPDPPIVKTPIVRTGQQDIHDE